MAVLSQLILIHIRGGEIKKAQECLETSENGISNKNDSGLCFCRGIIYKNMGEPKKALKEFNKAKREQAYADESLRYMIEIFLNPQNDLYFSFSDELNSIKQINSVTDLSRKT